MNGEILDQEKRKSRRNNRDQLWITIGKNDKKQFILYVFRGAVIFEEPEKPGGQT